jgi:hypothetical protein
MTRFAALLLCAAACGIPQNNPGMEPGEDCMSCHSAQGTVGAPTWTAAGTLFGTADAPETGGLEGGKIHLTDSAGQSYTLTTNAAGNFYLAEQLKYPLTKVEAEFGGRRMAMVSQPPNGACNSCHSLPAQNDAPGRLFVPSSAGARRR